ncbi:MAG TPA: guanylate kinase [Dissulfurispiraceae bacterium]|nr:guanylate kinase [Dissulfurispiraceae bacterium]
MKRRVGTLIVVSAPSGAGKSTLCGKLLAEMPDVRMSVSYTTRPPRQGERDGIHYSFISIDAFRRMIESEAFVEWAEVHGNYYGTSKARIQEILDAGADVILDIDVQGAAQIRRHFPASVHIFILPPSLEVLRKRLEGRMSDPPEVIERRLHKAREEIQGYIAYDYVIINDSLTEALQDLRAVVRAERVRVEHFAHAWAAESFLKEEQ